MRNVNLSIVLVAIAAGFSFGHLQGEKNSVALTQEQAKSDEPKSKIISVTKFDDGNVVGYLGQPLGTIVRVTGMAIDGDSTRRKKNMGKTLLEVRTVNGKKLEAPTTFEFSRAVRGIQKPKSGTKFDYYAHEYGEFDGVVVPPKKLQIDFTPIAHDGFYYRRYLSIHKSIQ